MYNPKINDYVIWHHKTHPIKGWVYFVDSIYITIETHVKNKDEINLRHSPYHKKTHCLVVCYAQYWKQLEYVKSRTSSTESD